MNGSSTTPKEHVTAGERDDILHELRVLRRAWIVRTSLDTERAALHWALNTIDRLLGVD